VRRHRVRIEGLVPGERRLVGPAAHHLARVLRVRPGAPIAAFDGRGAEAFGTVLAVDAEAVLLDLEAPHPSATEPERAVTLAPALLKGDKLADVVRMATELGVVAVRPVRTRRCDVTELAPPRLARWRRVAEEAARQCGRARVPEVAEAVRLDALSWTGRLLVADPEAEATLADAVAELDGEANGGGITVVTGPEGGLDPDEVAALVARGGRAVALGRRVLRAETAPVAIAAALLVWDGS
jgi:16S rRNA (uracil1498-N3)-methyltransferase